MFWAVVLSVAVSLSVVLALAALNRYSFERLLIADAGVAAAAAILARGRLRFGPAARRVGLTAIVPVALVLIGLWRFFPSSEYVIGGKDPGTYMNEGIQIAQRGALVFRDPVVSSVPPFARDLFFPSHQRHDYYGTRFMGFFIKNPDSGAVVGQFPHLFPASIAIGYGIDGLNGARRTVGVWAILGILAVYFAGARIAGRTAAGAAAALLSLHVIQVWFSRYPNAEVVMQALLFAALLANARAHVDGDRFFAPVAAGLLGLLLFLRFDAVLAIAGVAGGLALAGFNGATASSLVPRDLRRGGCACGALPAWTNARVRRVADRFSQQPAGVGIPGSRPGDPGGSRWPLARDDKRSLQCTRCAFDTDRRHDGSVGAGSLCPVHPPSCRQAGRARRVCAADLHRLLPDAPGAHCRTHRHVAARTPRILARPCALRHRRGLFLLLLLQDQDRHRPFLDDPAVPAGDSPWRAAVCRVGSPDRDAAQRLDRRRHGPSSHRRRLRRLTRASIRPCQPATAAARGICRPHPKAPGTRWNDTRR